jgi:hypothetical protein
MQQPVTADRSHKGLSLVAFCLAATLLAGFARPVAADVVIGGTNSSNVFPFGIGTYTGEYQQVYLASAFPGTVAINSVAFETVPSFGTPTGIPVTLSFTMGLSNTTASPSSLSTSYAANKGANFTTVFSGSFTYTPLANGTFDFVVPTIPFTYNPGNGNLLVDVVINTPSPVQQAFVSGIGQSTTGRVFNLNGNGTPTANPGGGLLTRFGTTPAAVPEPSSLALAGVVGACALGYGGLRRGKRAA